MSQYRFFCVPCRRTFAVELNEEVYDRGAVVCPICHSCRPGFVLGPLSGVPPLAALDESANQSTALRTVPANI
jgi:hypothetical protein